MNDKNEVLIQVQDLKKAFGKLEVLRGISTEIKKGEVVVVIGPSGSGKSTFLRSLNLLEVPTGGTVLLKGRILQTQRQILMFIVRRSEWCSSISICFHIRRSWKISCLHL